MLHIQTNLNEYPKVKLNEEYIKRAYYTAGARDVDSQHRGYRNRRGMDDKRAKEITLQGCLGEAALYQYLNEEYRISVNEIRKQDYLARDGRSYNIKTTKNPNELTLPQSHVDRGDNFIYVVELPNGIYAIIGYILNKDVKKLGKFCNPNKRYDDVTGEPSYAYVVAAHHFKAIKPSGRN